MPSGVKRRRTSVNSLRGRGRCSNTSLNDHVVLPRGVEVLREETCDHVVSARGRRSCNIALGLESDGVVPAVRCRIEEPSMRTAYIEDAPLVWADEGLEAIEDALEVAPPQVAERGRTARFFDSR